MAAQPKSTLHEIVMQQAQDLRRRALDKEVKLPTSSVLAPTMTSPRTRFDRGLSSCSTLMRPLPCPCSRATAAHQQATMSSRLAG